MSHYIYPSTKKYFFDGKFVELEDLYEQEFQLAIITILFDELNNSNENFYTISRSEYLNDMQTRNLRGTLKMCGMSAIGIDYTRSGAKGHSYYAAAEFIESHPGTVVTEQDQGCVWEDFGCVYVITMQYPC